MKKQSSQVLNNTMSKETLNSLTTIVSETLAFNATKETKTGFIAAQLWDIQRRKRPVVLRRYYQGG